MPQLSRRVFALGAPAAAAAAAAAWTTSSRSVHAQGSASSVHPLAQVRIGRFTVTALTDGYADMPFHYFPGSAPEAVEAAAQSLFVAKPGGIRFMFNQYLVDDGERLILIDTGPAGRMGETGGLPDALASIGVDLARIGAVIVTHLHVDHIGGLVAGGQKRFANAEIYADRRDVAYWTDPARRAAAPDFLKTTFDASAELVRLYPALHATDGEPEISRGVTIVDLTGHTPGHIGVRIEDAGESLLMVSDMLFPVVHPSAADVGFLFEQDPAAAQSMRARFFPRAADEASLIAATHMAFPGLGRIVSDEGELRWLAADWAHQD